MKSRSTSWKATHAFIVGLCVGTLLPLGFDVAFGGPPPPSALELSAIRFYEAEAAKSKAATDYLKASADHYKAEIRKLQAMDGLWQEGEVPVLHMPKEVKR